MATSVALKNSILIFLVVLILHFLLKNALANGEGFAVEDPHIAALASVGVKAPPAAPIGATGPLADEETMSGVPSTGPIGRDATREALASVSRASACNEDELYAYVFGDEATPPRACEAAEAKKPAPTTRAAAPAAPAGAAAPPAPKLAPGSNSTCQLAVINEYADEKGLNGGPVLGSLSAFDMSQSPFEQLL